VTLLIAGMCTLVCLTVGSFAIDVTSTYAHRTRAQTAADAAALAAVAEATPYGAGDPRSVAVRFAELNGARVTRCLCDPGATAVQVTVSVEGVVARARAVFEPDLMGPGLPSLQGLHPSLRRSVDRLLARAGGSVSLVSGFRSSADQARLWEMAVDRYGDPELADDWVARPGTSMHERGLAVDLGGDLDRAASLVRELGLPLLRPLASEPWHFELRLSRIRSQ
jgi:hypothetical protein